MGSNNNTESFFSEPRCSIHLKVLGCWGECQRAKVLQVLFYYIFWYWKIHNKTSNLKGVHLKILLHNLSLPTVTYFFKGVSFKIEYMGNGEYKLEKYFYMSYSVSEQIYIFWGQKLVLFGWCCPP